MVEVIAATGKSRILQSMEFSPFHETLRSLSGARWPPPLSPVLLCTAIEGYFCPVSGSLSRDLQRTTDVGGSWLHRVVGSPWLNGNGQGRGDSWPRRGRLSGPELLLASTWKLPARGSQWRGCESGACGQARTEGSSCSVSLLMHFHGLLKVVS